MHSPLNGSSLLLEDERKMLDRKGSIQRLTDKGNALSKSMGSLHVGVNPRLSRSSTNLLAGIETSSHQLAPRLLASQEDIRTARSHEESENQNITTSPDLRSELRDRKMAGKQMTTVLSSVGNGRNTVRSSVGFLLPVSEESVFYSERETETLKELFLFMSRKYPQYVIKGMSEHYSSDEGIKLIISMGFVTGSIFRIIRRLIEIEFEEVFQGGRGNLFSMEGITVRFISYTLLSLGFSFLKDRVGPYILKEYINQPKLSWELNPKFTDQAELEENKRVFQKKMDIYLDVITCKASSDTLPMGIKAICGCIKEVSQEWIDKGHSINWQEMIARVLVLGFFNSALSSPEEFLGKSGALSSTSKRNMELLRKFMHHTITEEDYPSKERYFGFAKSFSQFNRAMIFRYISLCTVPSSTALSVPREFNVVTFSQLYAVHGMISKSMDDLSGTPDGEEFRRGLGKMGDYKNKIFYSQLSANEQKLMKGILRSREEEALFMQRVMYRNKAGEQQKVFLIVGLNRVLLVDLNGKVMNEGHYVTLEKIKSSEFDRKQVDLIFTSNSILLNSEFADDILNSVYRAYLNSFYNVPAHMRVLVDVEPPERLQTIISVDVSPCDGFVSLYQAVCDYYRSPVHKDLCWDVNHLKDGGWLAMDKIDEEEPNASHALDLRKYLNTANPENDMTENDLIPIFHTMRYNTWFTTLIVKDCKIEKKEVIQVYQDMLRYNDTLRFIVFSGVQSRDASILLDGLSTNVQAKISHLDISNTPMDVEAATQLSRYILQTEAKIHYIDVSGTNVTPRGITSVLTAITNHSAVTSELRYLNVSNNAVGTEGSAGLKMLLCSAASDNLSTLVLSGVQTLNLQVVVKGLIFGRAPIQFLDLSNNVLDDMDAFIEYLKNDTQLEYLSLSKTHLDIDTTITLLTNLNENLLLHIDLSHNNIGLSGAIEISRIAYKMNNVRVLNLADNDLTDEGVTALALGLRNNHTLKKLILDHNLKASKMKTSRDAVVRSLTQLIDSDCSLESLRLMAKPGTTSALRGELVPLIESLETNRKLVELDITGHQMGNAGAVAMGKVLQTNTTLRLLNWDRNDTGLTGFLGIKYALKMNMTLQSMSIPVADLGMLVQQLPRELQMKLKKTAVKISLCLARNASFK